MNERIRELRTQAAAWVTENHQPQDPNAYSQKEIDQRYLMYEEKFAELIVAECMEVFSKDLPEPGDGRMLEVINRVCDVADHFGVEE